MQVLPLGVEMVFGLHPDMRIYSKMYLAMLDYSVHCIYCLFCILTCLVFYCISTKNEQCVSFNLLLKERNLNPVIYTIFISGIISPAFTWLFSPDPSIYLEFARFIKMKINIYDPRYLYHTLVVSQATMISFICAIVLYFFNDKKNKLINFIVFLGIGLSSWSSGKRALFMIAICSILFIDVIKHRYKNQSRKLVIKSIILIAISLLFFVIYKYYSGKDASSDFLVQYNQYYSRLGCVKTAIYSILYNDPILEYPGQSLLYNLFFFVPRSYWLDKPAMLCKYFTSYSMNLNITSFLPWNLHVNIWTEFIANLGVAGYILALILINRLVRILDNTKNCIVLILGLSFILFYFMFGFELFITVAFVLFILSLLYTKIREHL